MMVIVILGVLVAIALPSYRNQVLKGNRAVAKAKLLELAGRQEQYFADNKFYSNTLDAFLGLGTTNAGVDDNYNWVAAGSPNAIYQLSVTTSAIGAVSNMAYVLTATPVNRQTADAGRCGSFTINQFGQRAVPSGSLGMDCWN